MGSFKHYALAGILALAASTTAHAADLLPPPPPMPYAPVEVGGGWYLRGDIGMTNQQGDQLSFIPKDVATAHGVGDESFKTVHHDFDSSPFGGVGVGYQFNHWIRGDLTGEYRGKSSFHGLESSLVTRGDMDKYDATKSEWVGLANVYFDLGTWYGLTPFVGAGVGFTRTKIDNFVDTFIGGNGGTGGAFANSHSETDLAWAVHAGVAYDVTPNFKVELAYRYLNLGDAQTGTFRAFDNSGCNCVAAKFKDLDSHDFKVGLRWMLGGPVMAASNEPIIRKY
jgi:opacity protein-like surface antigen